jgi:hypothetical protein
MRWRENFSFDDKFESIRHDFLDEAGLFAVIVLTAFLPLINNAHALVEFVRAIANF